MWFREKVGWVSWRGSAGRDSTHWKSRGVCCTHTLEQFPTSPRIHCTPWATSPLSLRLPCPICKLNSSHTQKHTLKNVKSLSLHSPFHLSYPPSAEHQEVLEEFKDGFRKFAGNFVQSNFCPSFFPPPQPSFSTTYQKTIVNTMNGDMLAHQTTMIDAKQHWWCPLLLKMYLNLIRMNLNVISSSFF